MKEDNDYKQKLVDKLLTDFHISNKTLETLYGNSNSSEFQFGIQELLYLLDPNITFTQQLKGIIDTILSYGFTYETLNIVSTCNIDAIIDFHKLNKNLNNEEYFNLAMASYRIFLIIVQNTNK